jgi:hypothetical protein
MVRLPLFTELPRALTIENSSIIRYGTGAYL